MGNEIPAGWYPDGQGRQRYWDGSGWTQHTAPLPPATPPPPVQQWPSGPAPASSPYPPPSGFQAPPSRPGPPASPWIAPPNDKNWFERNKGLSIFLGVIGVVILLAVIGSFLPSDDDEPADAGGSGGSDAKGSSPAPTLEDRFIDVVDEGREAADDADNEIGVVEARKERATAMCDVLPSSLQVTDWSGTVEDVSTELGGDDGVMSVKITDEIAVQTWNNGLSASGAGTMIAAGSNLYATLADLGDGDDITFSGTFIEDGGNCVQEQSLLDENGMLTPDFSFRFSSITKD